MSVPDSDLDFMTEPAANGTAPAPVDVNQDSVPIEEAPVAANNRRAGENPATKVVVRDASAANINANAANANANAANAANTSANAANAVGADAANTNAVGAKAANTNAANANAANAEDVAARAPKVRAEDLELAQAPPSTSPLMAAKAAVARVTVEKIAAMRAGVPTLARRSDAEVTPFDDTPVIELRGVTYSIEMPDGARRTILDDISLQIMPRTINCIMGTSGSGKTTLLRLMAGLIRPDRGEILVFGHNIVAMSEREQSDIQRRTGFVFQYSALFDSLDVGHNIGFGLSQRPRFKRPSSREIRQTVARLLQEVGLPGIEGKRPSELSGGMKKRVAMARALANDPEIVFYDEPDSGLDPVMTSIIDDLIIKVRDQNHTTNIVVTHNVSSIWRIADRVLMIHDGSVVADGTTAEVERSDVEAVQQFLQGRTSGPLVKEAEPTQTDGEAPDEEAEIEADAEFGDDFG